MSTTRRKRKKGGYQDLAQSMRDCIRTGIWQVGGVIPSRRGLAKQFGVALPTIEKAISLLVSEGLLSTKNRQGTFVARQTPTAAPSGAEPQGDGPFTATIGLIAPIIPYETQTLVRDQWSARALHGCERVLAEEAGVSQCFVNLVPFLGGDIPVEKAVKQILAEKIDGLLLINRLDGGKWIDAIEEAGIPTVCLSFGQDLLPLPHVTIDETAGGVQAVRHLRARGYDPLYFLHPFSHTWSQARLAGAWLLAGEQEIEVLGLDDGETPGGLDVGGEAYRASGRKLAKRFLAEGFKPGAGVIAPNDQTAVGFISYLKEQGIMPGKQYGIVGFDDDEREIQLTSLHPPIEQLGEVAATMLLTRMRGEVCPSRVALPANLIARMSTNRMN